MATDNDVGDNAKLTYYLAEGEMQFAVDAETGVISTVETLNCQQNCPQVTSCPKSCVLTVFARDHGSPRQDGRTYVTINLLDANDHDPIIRFRYFPATASAATVDENAHNGSVVAAVSVIDMDEGANGETNVEIRAGNEQEHFRLDRTPSFDLVRVNGVLDREKISRYNLTIVATDRGFPPRSSTSFLIINVNDINDHEPVFGKSEYSAVVSELVPVGTYVASITATDEDTGINSEIYYAIVSGNDHRWFSIDAKSGLVTTSLPLDREQQGTVQLKISARDGGPNPKWAHTYLKITILDENDESPKFSNRVINVTLSESAAPMSLVAAFSAVDHDQGTNGSVTYTLDMEVEHKYPGMFELDASTGQLTTKTKLDRETISEYVIKVVAKDQGIPPLSSTAAVFLKVDDVNDNSPEFYPQEYFVTVPEDLSVGSEVVRVLAEDADEGANAAIKFKMESGADGVFGINEETGVVTLLSELKTKRKKQYQLRVSAKDQGDRRTVEDAVVEILVEANDVGTVDFTQKNGYFFHILEDHSKKEPMEGREVGQVEVTGIKPGQLIKYSVMSGDPGRIFAIDERSGVVRTAKRIDREVQASYHLLVVAKTGPSYGTANVTITIDDVNDNQPKFNRTREVAYLKENSPIGQEVYLAQAIDYDKGINSKITYSLTSNSEGIFTISKTTGMIYLAKPVQFRIGTGSSMSLEVTATDSGNPALSSRQQLTVEILDVNDHTPVFDQPSYETSLLESTPLNDRFFALAATDDDDGDNGRISYEITEGNVAQKFGVFPDGYLYVKGELDREEQDYFSLVVVARDHGEPMRSSQVAVVVHVIDENDNEPQFTNATFNFHVLENEPPDTFVGKLTATDIDVGRNAELTFSLPANQPDFMVDPKNGFIKTLHVFDREALVQNTGHNYLTLEAIVTDNGVNRLKDKVKVNIYVVDMNDNAPEFIRTPDKTQISEGAPLGSHVVRVFAMDWDEGLNGDIVYSIVSGNAEDKFRIDSTTGQISLAGKLDRETISQYVLTVLAQDAGEQQRLNSTTHITVDVLDENDNAPEFTQSESLINILESTAINTELLQFQASDLDLGINRQITFSIAGGNRQETFRMDPVSGALYLNRPLDYERVTTYKLNITASDAGNPRLATAISFLVNVVDCNDNAPVFPNTALVRQIQEGIQPNTSIVTVTAEDPDSGVNGVVRYSLQKQDPPGRHFGIHPEHGTIHTLLPIDREFADTFRLTVAATDQADKPSERLTAEKIVTVIVEDVNDNAPVFVSMNAGILRRYAEKGTEVMRIIARDLDSGTNGLVTYELASGDASLFHLDRSTGLLRLRRAVAEPDVRYHLSIKASDEAVQTQRKSSETYVTVIGGGDAGGSSIKFERSYYDGSVYENEPAGTSILSVKANNARGDVQYYVTNVTAHGKPVERLFDVDPGLGVLSTVVPLDRETGADEYEIVVYAITLGVPTSQTTVAKVRISVLDRNDSPPSFGSHPLVFNVSEDLLPGGEVAVLKATDPDTLGTLNYSLLESNDDGKDAANFVLEPTGNLRIKHALDREQKEEYHMTVRVNDGIQHQDATVTVKVLDTNDNPPLFPVHAYSFEVREDAQRGSIAGVLRATDADEGTNSQITYAVLSDWGNDVFSLHPQTGVFALTARLDYEEVQHYIVVVSAQDAGQPSLSSTVTVYFNVLDLNDNAPVFDPMSYSDEIDEDAPVGTSILTVTASDLDSGDNGRLMYEIVSGNDDGSFSLAPNGTLYTTKPLDRETHYLYELVVRATDQAEPEDKRLSSTVQVSVVLRDVNDMAPEFVSPNVTTMVENTPANSVILAVKAVDRDEGRNSYVEYSLQPLDANGEKVPFVLGHVDGLLRVVRPLDREVRSSYTLRVTAKDRGTPPKSSVVDILVKVLDENDNSPSFDPKQYSATVAENATIGLSVLQVSATDVDEGLNGRVRYAIVAGDQNRDFSIGEDTGIIRVAKNLNYERKSHYLLTIQAEDSGDAAHYDSATVSIAVTDINDNAPVFLDSPYVARVLENAEVLPAPVVQVTAFDADTPPYNQVRYLLKDGDKGLFRVNATSGLVTVHRPLDRETQSDYYLTVVAMDTGTPRLTGTGTVRVIVEDVNDHAPEFERAHYVASVRENSPVGTFVLRAAAEDQDAGVNAEIRYWLDGSHSEKFAVDAATGTVTTKEPIDREQQREYRLLMRAVDGSRVGAHTATVSVLVHIEDENDNSPVFASPTYEVYVPEGTKPGQFVVGVDARDADEGPNGRIRYELQGPEATRFTVDPETGVVMAAEMLTSAGSDDDAEEPQPIRLQIRASDRATTPLSAVTNVVIHLRPAALFPTVGVEKDAFDCSENAFQQALTRAIGRSPKSGADGRIRYALAGGNVGGAFAIDSTTGEISIAGGLDYETVQSYQLWVEARDSDKPPLASVARIRINVTDYNDNAPVFTQTVYNASVAEEEHPPLLVATVSAFDADSGRNGRVQYQLRSGGDSVFSLNADTGEIFTTVKLNREETSWYSLVVEAVDQGTPQRTGTATVEVSVADKNDNPPRFTRLFSVNVTENTEPGSFVIQVTSVDRDVGENANATYSFTENPGGKFAIDALTGNVTVSGILDREQQDEYLLKVAAVDGSWRAETPLTITIQDQNDNAPQFDFSDYSFNLAELQRSVVFVGQVSATDRDKQGPNSAISYSLKQPSDFFSVDPPSGEIYSKQAIMYKPGSHGRPSPENQYSFVVVATDNGKPPLSSDCTITVNVVDANNNAPVFSSREYFTPVPEDASMALRIIQVEAIDALDTGLNAAVEYAVVSGNGTDLFDIEKETGWIIAKANLRNKRMTTYNLVIEASDSGIPPQRDTASVTLVVTGENRHKPSFSAPQFRVIAPENEPLGSVIVTLSATDKDEGPNGMLTYQVLSGNDEGKFHIDPKTGAVIIAEPLDYDTNHEYTIYALVIDRGFYPRNDTAELSIILTDVNDNPPTFNQSAYDAYVSENMDPGTPVIQLTANDIDSAKYAIIRYALVGGNGKDVFSIDNTKGIITTRRVFDTEEKAIYDLEVVASNPDSSLYGAARVRVHITGQNEFYPKFIQPVFQFTVSESATIGTKVGVIQATDQDSGSDGDIYYLLVGASNDRGFSVHPRSGVISINRRLDREAQSRVVLTVMAKNSGSIKGNDTDEAQVIVTIQDGNDPPAFEKAMYEAHVTEAAKIGTPVVNVKAFDKDVRPNNSRFSYSIIGGNADRMFQVDPVSGAITTAAQLDREKVDSYVLTVGAIDRGSPPQTGTTEVKVVVEDVNDNAPTLSATQLRSGSVPENEPAPIVVVTLSAVDADIGPNGGPFTYLLVGGQHRQYFQVNRSTGQVQTTRTVDREETPELRFQVEVVDNGQPALRSRHELTVKVTDKNDSPSSPRTVRVLVRSYQKLFPLGLIANIRPSDPDLTGHYSCHIVNSTAPENLFTVPRGCDLHVSNVTDGQTFTLKAAGSDGQHPEVISTIDVEFSVFDNSTVANSVTIRILNATAEQFLTHLFTGLEQALKTTFADTGRATIYGVLSRGDHVDITLAVHKRRGGYIPKNDVVAALKKNKAQFKQAVHGSEVLLGFSQCESRPCGNGGVCSESINIYRQTHITDSQSLVLTGPLLRHDMMCRCPAGFTGEHCKFPIDPCGPNPCLHGGSCTKQGNDFECQCPQTHFGQRCEMERNQVCHSSLCQNGGTCQETSDGSYFCLCRPSFLGNQCELASDACRPNPCLNGGSCIGLKPGYKCQCSNSFYGTHCEKSAFGFAELSFLAFPSLDGTTNDLAVVFATTRPDALLLYNFGEQSGGRSDFVALELREGRPVFSFGGARTAVTVVAVPEIVSDGNWHKVTATRNGRVASLSVSKCHDSGEICEECRHGQDSTCYADAVGPSGTFNFNQMPLMVGGMASVDPLLERWGQVRSDDFVGCVHSVWVNGRPLPLDRPLTSRGISPTCQRSSCEETGVATCGEGTCIDLWNSLSCHCPGGIVAADCQETAQSVGLLEGAYLELRPTENHKRHQLLRAARDTILGNSLSITFRTIQKDAVLLLAATNGDYTLVQIVDGRLEYTSKLGQNVAINMTVKDMSVSDGYWHNLTLYANSHDFVMMLDGGEVGDKLEVSSVHDFLDPYLVTLSIGGSRDERLLTNNLISSLDGCVANLTINGELQPLWNGSGRGFGEALHVGKAVVGCSVSITGAATAPDPLSIGVTLVIVFFVILIVAILVSFVVFRLRRQKREKAPTPAGSLKPNGTALLGLAGDAPRPPPPTANFLDSNGDLTADVMRTREMANKKCKEQRPDIIEREIVNKPPVIPSMRPDIDCDIPLSSPGGVGESEGIPEHYDLENASSIAPSDIDIIYHYKGYRDGNVRRYKAASPALPPTVAPTPQSGNYLKHAHRHSPHAFPTRESPRHLLHQTPPPRESGVTRKMQSTPLARLSPSSELSQQTPRILTLQDISGKPLLQTALTNSERSLTSPVSHLSRSSESMPQPPRAPGSGGTVGLTAEEIERLNARPKTSSLVSTLDAVSSSSNGPQQRQDQMTLLDPADSSTDESGNDSFTCSEFEFDSNYDKNNREVGPFGKLGGDDGGKPTDKRHCNGGIDSFRGSLSTLVASDDDAAYMNPYKPSNGSAAIGWDYLLNWGPNFETLAGVFKDIAELPDTAPSGRTSATARHGANTPKSSEEYV